MWEDGKTLTSWGGEREEEWRGPTNMMLKVNKSQEGRSSLWLMCSPLISPLHRVLSKASY